MIACFLSTKSKVRFIKYEDLVSDPTTHLARLCPGLLIVDASLKEGTLHSANEFSRYEKRLQQNGVDLKIVGLEIWERCGWSAERPLEPTMVINSTADIGLS
jgi:hypothetical protein